MLAHVQNLLWQIVQCNPLFRLNEILQTLEFCGIETNKTWLSRQFKAWHWTFKKPSYKQKFKYTKDNILHYTRYMHWASGIPWIHLKFVDESSFSSRVHRLVLFVLKMSRNCCEYQPWDQSVRLLLSQINKLI